MKINVTEENMEEYLASVLASTSDFPIGEDGYQTSACMTIETFEEAGVLTSNKGLVITLENNQEFQITIVRSR